MWQPRLSKAVTIVVGQDELAFEFQSLAQKYNGELYDFEEIKVISVDKETQTQRD